MAAGVPPSFSSAFVHTPPYVKSRVQAFNLVACELPPPSYEGRSRNGFLSLTTSKKSENCYGNSWKRQNLLFAVKHPTVEQPSSKQAH